MSRILLSSRRDKNIRQITTEIILQMINSKAMIRVLIAVLDKYSFILKFRKSYFHERLEIP